MPRFWPLQYDRIFRTKTFLHKMYLPGLDDYMPWFILGLSRFLLLSLNNYYSPLHWLPKTYQFELWIIWSSYLKYAKLGGLSNVYSCISLWLPICELIHSHTCHIPSKVIHAFKNSKYWTTNYDLMEDKNHYVLPPTCLAHYWPLLRVYRIGPMF